MKKYKPIPEKPQGPKKYCVVSRVLTDAETFIRHSEFDRAGATIVTNIFTANFEAISRKVDTIFILIATSTPPSWTDEIKERTSLLSNISFLI